MTMTTSTEAPYTMAYGEQHVLHRSGCGHLARQRSKGDNIVAMRATDVATAEIEGRWQRLDWQGDDSADLGQVVLAPCLRRKAKS